MPLSLNRLKPLTDSSTITGAARCNKQGCSHLGGRKAGASFGASLLWWKVNVVGKGRLKTLSLFIFSTLPENNMQFDSHP